MANIIRTSKSGRDWTPNDLLAYNISVEYQDSQTFFGIANLPQPHVDNEVLIAPDAAATQHDDPYILLRTMDLAMAIPPGEESAVDDFAVQLFRVLSYTGRAVGRVARTRKDLPFWVCGEQRHAKTDVCIMDQCPFLISTTLFRTRMGRSTFLFSRSGDGGPPSLHDSRSPSIP